MPYDCITCGPVCRKTTTTDGTGRICLVMIASLSGECEHLEDPAVKRANGAVLLGGAEWAY